MIVDAVRLGGGFSIKLSHRFLVGVPDLLIQLPGRGTSLWECKIGDAKYSGINAVKMTPLQYNFLRDYAEAGGKCGLISVLRTGAELLIVVVPFGMLDSSPDQAIRYRARSAEYTTLSRGHREKLILEEICRVCDDQ